MKVFLNCRELYPDYDEIVMLDPSADALELTPEQIEEYRAARDAFMVVYNKLERLMWEQSRGSDPGAPELTRIEKG
jgi:hypothetical protein